jgi:hypothetical protein
LIIVAGRISGSLSRFDTVVVGFVAVVIEGAVSDALRAAATAEAWTDREIAAVAAARTLIAS